MLIKDKYLNVNEIYLIIGYFLNNNLNGYFYLFIIF